MRVIRRRRAIVAALVALVAVLAAVVSARVMAPEHDALAAKLATKEIQRAWQGADGPLTESRESMVAAQQFAEARTAPNGVVQPGAYSAAYAQLTGLPPVGGAWSNVSKRPYDADDIEYRDYYSNSSGGAGLVTGRITGLAADGDGYVYAAGAMGGVWRSSTGGGNWTPIADGLPTLSSGALELDGSGALWYATGEANTGGTSYAGTGVYRLGNPRTGVFTHPASRVGGDELESTTINAVRFGSNGRVWVATSKGIWFHSTDPATLSQPWTLSYITDPAALNQSTNTNAPYANIVNDLAVDPNDPNHVIAGVGFRNGGPANGFYETRDGGMTWAKVDPAGGIDKTDIGNVSFAFAGDGTLYVMNQSPRRINSLAAIPQTYLDGIYVSKNGLVGPWNRIASSDKLGATSGGSALFANAGLGYSPGIQSWYNQFLVVDPRPGKSGHVFAGLEEVYETKNGGSNWTTPGPYWNFYFGCWALDAVYPVEGQTGSHCPLTTHSDQHAAAIGKVNGKWTLYVGNDGGIYSRPLDGKANRNGNAIDWKSLNDGTIDATQYYAVDIGKATGAAGEPDGSGDVVSGGLQDNGGSIFRTSGAKVSQNFGGDGGDVLVDPNNGCNIVQEYVVLAMRVTQTCASPKKADGTPNLEAWLDLSQATTYSIAPPDVNARFIAPFVADASNIDRWLAGGASLWFQKKGFAIRSGSEWRKVHSWANAGQTTTALAYDGETAIATWCGPCNNAGFTRGAAVGKYDAAADTWTWTNLALTGVPVRFLAAVAVDPNNTNHLFIGVNGFSRRFTEGPGAGVGHVYESFDSGATWSRADGTGAGAFPDVPVNSIQVLEDGALVVGTDLAVLYRAAGSTAWNRLGTNFPATVAIDVEVGPNGDDLYAATHGRGIWRIALP
ncbi:MAG TPA: glycosyl hydrolase [Actinomycetota bacterium]